jgi:hypothetical protein
MGERHRFGRRAACALAASIGALLLALALGSPGSAQAQLQPAEALTYIPFGFVHNRKPAALVDETLAALSYYGIGQAVLPMPKFHKEGTLKLTRAETQMISLWVAQAASYDAQSGAAETITADFQGTVKRADLDLEEAPVRQRIVAGIEGVLALGVGGVQLDFEPYPQSAGFLALLAQIREALARRGFSGRLSVTAPANRSTWSPSYMAAVTEQLDQVDPLFYDSSSTTAQHYEQWVREGLAYYTANSAPSARIIPVLPSYGPDRWHEPSVENIADATDAVESALGEGSRVNGAGIFWWWAFYLEEEGRYEPAADRAAWQQRTLALPFDP